MANESLRIDIVANNRAAIAGLKETTVQLNNVTTAASKTATAAAASGSGMSKAAVNYQNFGRVLQDLPYGFNAISNNLTQLIPSVGMLGIAFTGVVTALTFAQVGLGAWTRGMGTSTKATDEATKANKELAESYAQERGQLDTLYRTAINANQPLQIRLNSIKELRDNYGAYLKNFSDEEILAGKAATAYLNLANAIMMKARASAAQSKIDKIVADNLENELKIIDRMAKAQEEASKIKGGITQRISGGTGGLGTEISYTEQERRNMVFAKASKDIKEYSDGIAKASANLKFLQDQIQANQITPFTETKGARGAAATKDTYGQGFKPQNARREFTVMPERETLDTEKLKLQQGIEYNEIIATQITLRQQLNDQEMVALQLSEMGAQLFQTMATAIANGGNVGEALANAFKQIAIQIAGAVAQALIFAALMEAFPALKGVFATTGAVANSTNSSGSGGSNILGTISGSAIQLSQNRTRTSMGYRRGGI